MATEPVPAPPSSVSPAKSISPAQLQAELSSPKSAPPVARTPDPRAPTLPEPKEQKSSPDRPDFKAALRDRVKNAAPQEDATPKEEPPRKYLPKAEVKEEPKEEKKTAVSADDAPPAPKTAEDTPVPDDHKRVLPHDKPDTAKRIKALLADKEAARAEATAAKAALDEAKKAPSTPPEELAKLREEHEAAQKDLMRYRRLHDIDSDKEFAAKYREPVKQVEASIETTLKKNGLTDPVMEVIRKEGGFAAFSRSQKTFTVNEPDPDDSTKTIPTSRTAAELSRSWLNSMNPADSELVRASLGKQQLLKEEEKNAIAQAQDEAKTYFEGQTAAQRQQAEAAQQKAQAASKEYQDWVAEAKEKTEWLKDRPIPDNATPEQKAEITRHNEFNEQLRARLEKNPANVKEYGELKLEAAEAHHLRRTLGDKDARIAELEAQLSKSKNALRTTPKGGSLLKSDTAPKETNSNELGKNESPQDRLRSRLRKSMLGGQQGGDE